MRWVLLLLVACAPTETLRQPEIVEEPFDNRTLHAGDARCAPEAMAILDEADHALTNDPHKSLALTNAFDVPAGCDERIREHERSVRVSALRRIGASDIDVLRDLGDQTFDTSACKEDFAARCEEQRAWFDARFPDFVEGSMVRIRPMDRIPITPDGRLVVEYVETIDNRLPLFRGDIVAMTIVPTSVRVVGEDFELRVDGRDVDDKDGDGIKKGAHVGIRVPRSDFARAPNPNGAVVLLLRKSDWKTRGRLAFFSR